MKAPLLAVDAEPVAELGCVAVLLLCATEVLLPVGLDWGIVDEGVTLVKAPLLAVDTEPVAELGCVAVAVLLEL